VALHSKIDCFTFSLLFCDNMIIWHGVVNVYATLCSVCILFQEVAMCMRLCCWACWRKAVLRIRSWTNHRWDHFPLCLLTQWAVFHLCMSFSLCPPPLWGIKLYCDPSICLSQLGYSTPAACSLLATRDVRTADPFEDGRRSTASWTAIGRGHIVLLLLWR